uniref:Cilia and flagella associated protein 68 n=1 Tax=Anolis carolinensis TaxID=28377 RepID=H9GBH7_ANOCA
ITAKFFQYGWRCTTNEDSYNNKTLLGNWNEERYDVRKVLQAKPMPSQYAHCFESTYSTDYSKETPHSTRRVMREPHWFPGHQPELEPPPIKRTARSCYMMAYDDPHSKESRHLDEKLLRKPEETTQKQ